MKQNSTKIKQWKVDKMTSAIDLSKLTANDDSPVSRWMAWCCLLPLNLIPLDGTYESMEQAKQTTKHAYKTKAFTVFIWLRRWL